MSKRLLRFDKLSKVLLLKARPINDRLEKN